MSSPTDLRLTQSFLTQSSKAVFRYGAKAAFFAWQDERLARSAPLAKVSDQIYSRLRRGDAVPQEAMITFAAFLRDRGLKPWAIDDIAEAAPATDDDNGRESDALKQSWLEHVTTSLLPLINVDRLLPRIDPARSMCEGRADFVRGAEIVMKSIARHDGTGLTDDAAIGYGERMMRRSKSDLATWLEMAASVNPNSVMFALDPRNGSPDRIGFSVLVALKDEAYEAFRDGKIEDSDLGRNDLKARSKSIFVHSIFESDEINLKERRGFRSRNLMKTAFAQLALVSVPIHLDDTAIRLVSLEGTKVNAKRFESADYDRVGTKTPKSGKRIVECKFPEKGVLGNPKKLVAHFGMRLVITCYQQALAIRNQSNDERSK
jgi:hypothetical protein